jgi:hypothetical protein
MPLSWWSAKAVDSSKFDLTSPNLISWTDALSPQRYRSANRMASHGTKGEVNQK